MKWTAICALALLALIGVVVSPGIVHADVCLMAYPTSPCLYHYSSLDKYTVGPGDPLYDPAYDLNGEVLIKIDPIDGDAIALDVYQAPGLIGFVLDEVNQGYFSGTTTHDLVIDGYSKTPTTYTNIIIVFDTIEPGSCSPMITVDGNPAMFDPGLGYYYPIGDLVVSTPTAEGNSYSDTRTLSIDFQLCAGYRAWGFADENFNLMHDLPGECFTAYSHDSTVPTREASWGAIKAKYR